MTVYKLPHRRCVPTSTSTWCVRVRGVDGRERHQHFTRKNEADNFELTVLAERIGGTPAARRTVGHTFEQYAEQWRDAQTWKDHDGPRASLRRAYPLIGSKQLARIDGLTLQTLQRRLFEHPYARATVEQTMHFTKAALRQAHADGLVPTDPTLRVKLPRRDSLDTAGKVTAAEVPTRAEALAIISGAPSRYRAAVALGLGAGLRVGEVLGLSPNRVDLRAGTITIDRQRQRRGVDSPKTWRGVRTIEPPDLVMVELRRALNELGSPAPDMPIFVGGRGAVLRRDGFYASAWRPALVAAGLEPDRYRFHSARHFAVSNLLAQGVPVPEVAAYIGDAPGTVMDVYSHFLRGSESMAKRALDLAFLGESGEPARDNLATIASLGET